MKNIKAVGAVGAEDNAPLSRSVIPNSSIGIKN